MILLVENIYKELWGLLEMAGDGFYETVNIMKQNNSLEAVARVTSRILNVSAVLKPGYIHVDRPFLCGCN